ASDEDAGARLIQAQPGVVPGFGRRNYRDERSLREPPRTAPPRSLAASVDAPPVDGHRIVYRDGRHGRGDGAWKRRRVEVDDRAGRAAAPPTVTPQTVAPDAERRHHTDSRDRDARFAWTSHLPIIPAASDGDLRSSTGVPNTRN